MKQHPCQPEKDTTGGNNSPLLPSLPVNFQPPVQKSSGLCGAIATAQEWLLFAISAIYGHEIYYFACFVPKINMVETGTKF